MAVRRYDDGIPFTWELTPQGGIRAPARPTRVGVLSYRMPDGTIRRELRPPEEVLSPESLASLAHAPITDLHPEREGIRIPVTPENFRELSVGHVAEDARQDPELTDHVAATLLIQDAMMILKIQAGDRRELSCGYSCTLDPTPGTWAPTGEVFDVIQRGIVYNHVALGPTDWGRAGSSVALRLDSEDGIQVPSKESPMKTEWIDGREYTIGTPEHAAAKTAHGLKIQTLTQERDQAQGRADAGDRAVGLLAQAQKDLATATDPAKIAALVSRRARVVTDCARAAKRVGVKFDDAAAASMGEGDMIVQAIKLLDPGADVEGKSPDYLAGMFATLIKGLAGDEAAEVAAGDAPKDLAAMPPGTQPKTDSAKPSIFTARAGEAPQGGQRQDSAQGPDAARAALVQTNQERWKKPLAASK